MHRKTHQPMIDRVTPLLLLTITILLIFMSLYTFSQKVKEYEIKEGEKHLEEIAMQTSTYINDVIKTNFIYVYSLGEVLSISEDLKSEETKSLLKTFLVGTEFNELAIDCIDGTTIKSDGTIEYTRTHNYIKALEKKEPFITNIEIDPKDGKEKISLVVPLVKNGKVIGGIRGIINAENLSRILDIKIFNGQGYFRVIDSKGHILAKNNNENMLFNDKNYFEALEKLDFDPGYSGEKIIQDIKNKKSGYSSYSLNENGRYTYYKPLKMRDWAIIVTTPKWTIDYTVDDIQKNAYTLVIQVGLLVSIIFMIFIFHLIKSRKEAQNSYNQLLISKSKYQLLVENSDVISFEYSVNTGNITYSNKYEEFFNRNQNEKGLIDISKVHEDDQEKFKNIVQEISSTSTEIEVEIRILRGVDNYIWCKIRAISIFDPQKKETTVVGTIEDINEEKEKLLNLKEKAEKDLLTGIYNKITTEKLIKRTLSGKDVIEGKHSLFIIDIDNFKNVNDTFGHEYGDKVILEVANKLKEIFRGDDILGRMGGDEFFVFMKNYKEETVIDKKAQEICDKIRTVYKLEGKQCKISASIGIAKFPEDGREFEQMYHNADEALYETKKQGKDGYTKYSNNNS